MLQREKIYFTVTFGCGHTKECVASTPKKQEKTIIEAEKKRCPECSMKKQREIDAKRKTARNAQLPENTSPIQRAAYVCGNNLYYAVYKKKNNTVLSKEYEIVETSTVEKADLDTVLHDLKYKYRNDMYYIEFYDAKDIEFDFDRFSFPFYWDTSRYTYSVIVFGDAYDDAETEINYKDGGFCCYPADETVYAESVSEAEEKALSEVEALIRKHHPDYIVLRQKTPVSDSIVVYVEGYESDDLPPITNGGKSYGFYAQIIIDDVC